MGSQTQPGSLEGTFVDRARFHVACRQVSIVSLGQRIQLSRVMKGTWYEPM